MNKKTIIIIGATSGIGRALFEKYAADGNRIAIHFMSNFHKPVRIMNRL